MWIIDEIKRQAINTKTGLAIINKSEVDTLRLQAGQIQMDLTIEEEILNIVPPYRICQIIDSLDNFKTMDTIQVEEYVNDELKNFVEGMDDDAV